MDFLQRLGKLPSLMDLEKELATRTFRDFIPFAWPILEPATEFLPNWHIDAIAEHLEAVTQGEIKRLIINIPPRYMKSIETTVMWPVWTWIRKPSLRWIFASYSASLSIKHSVDRRTIIQSSWFHENWGDTFKLNADQNMKTEFSNDKRGHMIATSVGGTATGKGGDILIVDDPINPKEAESDVIREAANTWFDQTFYSRLDDKKNGAIVVVMQRLHENDLTGHLLQKGGWENLRLPAEAEEKQIVSLPISKSEIVREPGDILWPDREGPAELSQTKTSMGSYAYAGQYQQNPSPSGGGLLKRYWWRYWQPKGANLPPVTVKGEDGELLLIEPVDLPESLHMTLQSWDMAFKDTKNSAYVAGQIWAANQANRFLLDQIRDKLDFVKSEKAVLTLTEKWPKAYTKLIEDKANGPAIISRLKGVIGGIVPVQPGGSKEARAAAISPIVEAGNCYLPHPMIAPWVHDFVEECAMFPNGTYKDQVDAATQALNRLATSRVQIFV